VLGPGEVDPGLKQLIAYVASNASGCRYCQAHTSHSAEKRGVSTDKISEAFEFETSTKFSDAERAALRVALYGGITPNGVDASHMKDLAAHYSEKQIVEIVAVIALFGFLNRWNDTMATTLEDKPMSFAASNLSSSGWDAGKHSKG
jgi:AhpD family alkylhydroperoxidase